MVDINKLIPPRDVLSNMTPKEIGDLCSLINHAYYTIVMQNETTLYLKSIKSI